MLSRWNQRLSKMQQAADLAVRSKLEALVGKDPDKKAYIEAVAVDPYCTRGTTLGPGRPPKRIMFEAYIAKELPADAEVFFRVVIEVATEEIVSAETFVPLVRAAELPEPDLGA